MEILIVAVILLVVLIAVREVSDWFGGFDE